MSSVNLISCRVAAFPRLLKLSLIELLVYETPGWKLPELEELLLISCSPTDKGSDEDSAEEDGEFTPPYSTFTKTALPKLYRLVLQHGDSDSDSDQFGSFDELAGLISGVKMLFTDSVELEEITTLLPPSSSLHELSMYLEESDVEILGDAVTLVGQNSFISLCLFFPEIVFMDDAHGGPKAGAQLADHWDRRISCLERLSLQIGDNRLKLIAIRMPGSQILRALCGEIYDEWVEARDNFLATCQSHGIKVVNTSSITGIVEPGEDEFAT